MSRKPKSSRKAQFSAQQISFVTYFSLAFFACLWLVSQDQVASQVLLVFALEQELSPPVAGFFTFTFFWVLLLFYSHAYFFPDQNFRLFYALLLA